jgi:hypothetical protein
MFRSSNSWTRRLSAVAALGLVLGVTSAAWADASDDAIKRGVEKRRELKDAEALAEFQRAYSLRPTARALAQAGLAEQALSRWVEAERDIVQALASVDDAWIVDHRDTLSDALVVIRGHLGSVELSADESDVELWMGGARVATLPYTLRAAAGLQEVELRPKGRPAISRQVEVAAQRTLSQRFQLAPAAPAQPAAAPPSMPAPVAEPPAPVRETAAPPARESIEPSRSVWPWVTLGGAVALVAGGVTAHVVREKAAARFNDDERCFQPPQTREERCGSDLTRARTSGALAVVGYAGGALLGGLTAYLWLSDSHADSAPRAALRAGPGQALLTYRSSF